MHIYVHIQMYMYMYMLYIYIYIYTLSSYAWHDSRICVIRSFHMWNTTHLRQDKVAVRNSCSLRVTWLTHMCDKTPSYMKHDAFMSRQSGGAKQLNESCHTHYWVMNESCQTSAKDISLKIETQVCTTNPEITPRKAEYPIPTKLRFWGWGGPWVANIYDQHCTVMFCTTKNFVQFCRWHVALIIERRKSRAQNASNLETNVRFYKSFRDL